LPNSPPPPLRLTGIRFLTPRRLLDPLAASLPLLAGGGAEAGGLQAVEQKQSSSSGGITSIWARRIRPRAWPAMAAPSIRACSAAGEGGRGGRLIGRDAGGSHGRHRFSIPAASASAVSMASGREHRAAGQLQCPSCSTSLLRPRGAPPAPSARYPSCSASVLPLPCDRSGGDGEQQLPLLRRRRRGAGTGSCKCDCVCLCCWRR
jgi:hypothetical protein